MRNSDFGLRNETNADFGLQNAEYAQRVCLEFRNPQSAFRNPFFIPQSAIRIPHSALTLIELLVVIVILTTLVGGVIPILSPNNDERKIRVASRGLQGYITQAQAQAARTGRPQGIAFRESSAGSGVALELFGLEVPPPFAGFSTESRVLVSIVPGATPNLPLLYIAGNFSQYNFQQYDGFPLYLIQFQLAGGVAPDPLPPRMFRIGDFIDVGGNLFQIIDTTLSLKDSTLVGTAPNTVEYLGTAVNPKFGLHCVWINESGQVAPQRQKRYKINRQPTNSSVSPYQLPAGIVIDMQASVTEGNALGNRFPTADSLYTDRSTLNTAIPTDTVGIMFSPTGAVSSVIFNGNELTSVSRIVMLLGRIENGGIDPAPIVFSNNDTVPWRLHTNEKIEDVQERINWMNLDSRLFSIITSNGRAVVSEPAFVDPTIEIDADDQIEAAHSFAHEMTTAK